MVLTIRPANQDDYEHVVANLDAWWNGRRMAAMLPRLFFAHFRLWTYVAEEDGPVIGFLSAFQSQTDPGQVYCHFIGVDPAHRGHGIGEALYLRLFADAAERGCREILAVTSPANRVSLQFHARMGFDVLPGVNEANGIQFTPSYDGPGEDRVQLRKTLVSISKPGA